MSCQYCKREVKHRKPCKILVEMQERERLEAEQRKVEDEKRKEELINTTTDVSILRNEIERLRIENERLKLENLELKEQITELENPREDPYQYRCCMCGNQTGYDGRCYTCERIRSSDY